MTPEQNMITPELLTDHLELNPLAGMFDTFSLSTLCRTYSLPALRPVMVQVSRHQEGRPWAATVQVLDPDKGWQVLVFNRALVAQEDNGEAEADRLAVLAARLQIEARR